MTGGFTLGYARPSVKLAAGFLVLALLSPVPADTNARRRMDWYPLEIGSRWVYDSTDGEVVYEIKEKREIEGVLCTLVTLTGLDNPYGGNLWVARDPDGYRIHATQREKDPEILQPAVVILPTSPKTGKEWSWQGTWLSLTIDEAYEDLGEEVVLAAGRSWRCRKIFCREREKWDTLWTTWYAPGVGVVKETRERRMHGDGQDWSTMMVLREFRIGT